MSFKILLLAGWQVVDVDGELLLSCNLVFFFFNSGN